MMFLTNQNETSLFLVKTVGWKNREICETMYILSTSLLNQNITYKSSNLFTLKNLWNRILDTLGLALLKNPNVPFSHVGSSHNWFQICSHILRTRE